MHTNDFRKAVRQELDSLKPISNNNHRRTQAMHKRKTTTFSDSKRDSLEPKQSREPLTNLLSYDPVQFYQPKGLFNKRPVSIKDMIRNMQHNQVQNFLTENTLYSKTQKLHGTDPVAMIESKLNINKPVDGPSDLIE